MAGLLLGDAARAHIEEFVFIQEAGGRTVGADHVVRVDLKLRAGFGTRPLIEQQGVVFLDSLGPDCVRSHIDEPVEQRLGRVADDTFEELS